MKYFSLAILAISFFPSLLSASSPDLRLVREPGQEVVGDPGSQQGNVVAISPFLEPRDYQVPGAFYAKFDAYLRGIQKEGWISETKKTVVVLPEYIGIYLYLQGEEDIASLREPLWVKTVAQAAKLSKFERKMLALVATKYGLQPSGPQGAVAQAGTRAFLDRISATVARKLIHAKAKDMALTYDRVFSRLAAKYGVTLLAGSIPLPDPFIRSLGDGSTSLEITRQGKIHNTLAAYSPDGRLIQLVKKVHVPGGEGFVSEASLEQIRPIPTNIGEVGAIICADSWFGDVWRRIAGAKVAVVPEYADSAGSMSNLWAGYSLAKVPRRLNWEEARDSAGLTDRASYLRHTSRDTKQGGLTEHEALMTYTTPYWAPRSGIPVTLVVPNRAQMLDKGSDNGFIVTYPEKPIFVRKPLKQAGATLINIYLP